MGIYKCSSGASSTRIYKCSTTVLDVQPQFSAF